VKVTFLKTLAWILRGYFRSPMTTGKSWLWNNIIRKYLSWRKLNFICRTNFNYLVNIEFPDMIQIRIFFFGFWEPEISRYIKSKLKTGDIFIDIGANIGYYSLLAVSRVGRTGQVYAFEASPSVFSKLQANLAINKISNVVARNVAITNRASRVEIFKGEDINTGTSTIVLSQAERSETKSEGLVDGRPLSDVLEMDVIRRARMIKIDVEGAEWLVLNGIENIIDKLSDNLELIVEVNQENIDKIFGMESSILKIFSINGFSIFCIDNSYTINSYVYQSEIKLNSFDRNSIVQGGDFIIKKLSH
jgi:FkbM family methyltransferase